MEICWTRTVCIYSYLIILFYFHFTVYLPIRWWPILLPYDWLGAIVKYSCINRHFFLWFQNNFEHVRKKNTTFSLYFFQMFTGKNIIGLVVSQKTVNVGYINSFNLKKEHFCIGLIVLKLNSSHFWETKKKSKVVFNVLRILIVGRSSFQRFY